MRTNRTPDEWHTLFDEQQRSGLSQTQFCRLHGIARSAFSNARHRLSSRNTPDVSFVPALPPCPPTGDTFSSTTDSQPAHTPTCGEVRQLALTLPGAILTLPVDTSPCWLATLLREMAP